MDGWTDEWTDGWRHKFISSISRCGLKGKKDSPSICGCFYVPAAGWIPLTVSQKWRESDGDADRPPSSVPPGVKVAQMCGSGGGRRRRRRLRLRSREMNERNKSLMSSDESHGSTLISRV